MTLKSGITRPPATPRQDDPIAIHADLRPSGGAELILTDLKPRNLELPELARWFQEFYAQAPWDEHAYCGFCGNSDADPFGPVRKFSQVDALLAAGVCSTCRRPLDSYWSEGRVRTYIQNAARQTGFAGVTLNCASGTVGWLWGYELPSHSCISHLSRRPTFYIDVIGIIPAFRNAYVTPGALNQLASSPYATYLIALYDRLPLAGLALAMYLSIIQQARRLGYYALFTRTHRRAHNVRFLLRQVGFRETLVAPEDLDRSYWYLPSGIQ